MLEQEKLNREALLKELNISEDILSSYEEALEMSTNDEPSDIENFTKDDFESIKLFHKLKESGLTLNEIKLLGSFSEMLKTANLTSSEDTKNFLSLSPVYRLKQSLNITKQELELLKEKAKQLEEALNREIEFRISQGSEDSPLTKTDLDIKQKTISNLDRKLSEVLSQKAQLELQLSSYLKNGQSQVKGKKAKELYQLIIQKDQELEDIKKKGEELTNQLNEKDQEVTDLNERIELMEDEISEMELEIEERYNEQITSLREQIEQLINRKQQEWETFFVKSSEQHRKEILTLQKKHEVDVIRLKQRIKEQIELIEELNHQRNPILSLFKTK